ncbi:MAG: DUF3971 domain-containing protein, partial [Candidatus Berkiella sp.]
MNFKSFYSVYRVLGWTSIVIASGLLILRFITPLMTPRVPQLSDWVAKELRYPTLIQEIKLNWDGLCPEVSLYNVQILTQNKKTTALHVQKIKLRLNVFQLLFKRLHVEELILDGVVGGVTYNHQDKNLAITNLNQLNFSLQSPQSDLFLLKRLLILNSTIKLDTDLGQNFALSGLNMLFESGSQIKVRAQAILDNEKKGHIELDVDYPYLSNKPKRFYCHWQNGDLNQLAKLIPNNVYAIKHQDADIKLWGDIVKKDITLHASLSLDNAQIEDTIKEPLFFNNLSGDLVAKLNASQWSLTSHDFKIVQDNQKENIQFSLKHSQQQSQPQWDILFKDFELAKWQQRLDDLNLLPQGTFDDEKLQGIAEYGHVILEGSNSKFKLVQGDVVLSQAGLSSKRYPSFSNAYGAITLNANEGKALLQSDALSLEANHFYEKPVLLDHLALVMNWQTSDDALTFYVDNFHADVLNTPIQGEAKIAFQKNLALPDVDLLLEVGESSAMTALSLLPTKAIDTDLTTWLNAAIKKGEHLGTTCVLRGNLTDFPFDNGEGTFEVYSELDKLHFEYNPHWPALFDLKANLHFRNRALFIGAENGAIENGKLIDADAVIPDLFSKMPEVIVDT